MDDIKDVEVINIDSSHYIKPYRMEFTQNDRKKIWDVATVHDSVSILIHNTTRDMFLFVKQFRPAMYLNAVFKTLGSEMTAGKIDVARFPGYLGITYELCAGIVDKQKPLVEIAQEEVLEETGYKVHPKNIEKITDYRSGMGVSSPLATMYYCTVTDADRIGAGGGLVEEGEMVDVHEVPVAEALDFVMDTKYNRPCGTIMAVLWYQQHKATVNSAKV